MSRFSREDYEASVRKYAKQANKHRSLFVDVDRTEIRVKTSTGERYFQFRDVCKPDLLQKVEGALLSDKVNKRTFTAFRHFCIDGMMVGLSERWPLIYDK